MSDSPGSSSAISTPSMTMSSSASSSTVLPSSYGSSSSSAGASPTLSSSRSGSMSTSSTSSATGSASSPSQYSSSGGTSSRSSSGTASSSSGMSTSISQLPTGSASVSASTLSLSSSSRSQLTLSPSNSSPSPSGGSSSASSVPVSNSPPPYGSSTTSSAPTTSSATPPAETLCPAYNNSNYTDSNGASYTVLCGQGIDGTPLNFSYKRQAAVYTIQSCMLICDKYAACVAVSTDGLKCNLFSSVTGTVGSPGSVAAYKVSGPPTNVETVTVCANRPTAYTTVWTTATQTTCPPNAVCTAGTGLVGRNAAH
jgi:hypothetical protein